MSESNRRCGGSEMNRDVNDGFHVVDIVPLGGWVDFGFDQPGEYIHIVPDDEARELRCYRTVGDAEVGGLTPRIKTTIENVGFTYHFDGEEEGELEYFYLTGRQGSSFLTFCDLLNRGREGRVNLSWYEESGMPMMENEVTGIETLTFSFTKENGVTRESQITSAWQSPRSHQMARIEGRKL